MMCLAGICGENVDSKQTQEKERELQAQVKELQGKLQANLAELANAKAQREMTEAQTAEKEQRKIELQAQLKAKEAVESKQSEAVKSSNKSGVCSCFDGLGSQTDKKQEEMKLQLEKLTQELKASETEASRVRDQAQTLEKTLHVEKLRSKSFQEDLVVASKSRADSIKAAPVAPPPQDDAPQRKLSFNSAFLKDLSSFRQQTPAVQREMKGSIQGLLADLQAAQDQLAEEQGLIEEATNQGLEHEKAVQELAPKVSNGLFQNLGGSQNRAWFRAQTPAKQREIQDELQRCLQQLEGAEVDKAVHQIRADSTTKRLSQMRDRTDSMEKTLTEQGKKPSFTYQQSQ